MRVVFMSGYTGFRHGQGHQITHQPAYQAFYPGKSCFVSFVVLSRWPRIFLAPSVFRPDTFASVSPSGRVKLQKQSKPQTRKFGAGATPFALALIRVA